MTPEFPPPQSSILDRAMKRKPVAGWNAKTDRERVWSILKSKDENSLLEADAIELLHAYGIDPNYAVGLMQKRWPEIYRDNPLAADLLVKNVLDFYAATETRPGKNASGDIFEGDGDPEKFGVHYSENDLAWSLNQIQIGLVKSPAPLYQMGNRLVHPYRITPAVDEGDTVKRATDSLVVEDVSVTRLREYVIENVHVMKLQKVINGKGASQFKPAAWPIPAGVANHLLERRDRWQYPALAGLIEAPTLRRDGSLLTAPGYDSQSGLLLDTGDVKFPDIKDEPTRADAEAALAFLKQPFKDFPFTKRKDGKSASRSVALSAVLTLLVRRTLRSAPAHATSAPIMATGKSLLLNAVGMIGTGREPAVMSQGANGEEDEKRLLSVLMKNDPMLIIDNITRNVEGDALCSILTEPLWQCRLLGSNRQITVPTNCLIAMSGNNLTFKGDMTTRAILCRLDAGVEHPEKRKFDVDLKTWIPANRGQLVAAGLTILRAFIVADRPSLDTFDPFGRFEDWSNLVRGALVWLDESDPCISREAIIAQDSDREVFGQFLDAVAAAFAAVFADHSQGVSAGDIVESEHDGVRQALDAIGKANDTKGLGHYLKAKQGQIVGGLRLTGKRDTHDKINRYRVTRAE
jgi:hypothetical protein